MAGPGWGKSPGPLSRTGKTVPALTPVVLYHPQGGIIIKLMNESFPKLLHQHINTHRNTYNDESCGRDYTQQNESLTEK